MFLVSLLATIITEERTHIITMRSCCRTHLTLFIPGGGEGGADLRTHVFYKLMPPEKRTSYSVLDLTIFCRIVYKQKVILERFDCNSTF